VERPDPAAALREVRDRIAKAARRAGRDPSQVRLVAVSKLVPAARVAAFLRAGHTLFGENRVQEAQAKIPQVGPTAVWHLVGHLQRNKARAAVGLFELIHGVDDLPLARELDRRAQAAGLVQRILVQLNLAGEKSKAGIARDADLWPLLDAVARLEHLELRGLMTIPPPVARAEDSRPWFARLREQAAEAARRLGRPLPELSMGMTDDFEVAVEEGATLVRIGRALFGERP
jgi:pyridoxal phosphate enzyme (YggS family)